MMKILGEVDQRGQGGFLFRVTVGNIRLISHVTNRNLRKFLAPVILALNHHFQRWTRKGSTDAV